MERKIPPPLVALFEVTFDEVIVNEINDSNVVVNEVKDNSVIEKETYKEKDEIKEAIVGDDEFNNVLQDRPYLSYKTHVQNRGWEKGYREDGEISGSTGSGLRLEAIEIYLKGIDEKYPDSDIEFSTYVFCDFLIVSKKS